MKDIEQPCDNMVPESRVYDVLHLIMNRMLNNNNILNYMLMRITSL